MPLPAVAYASEPAVDAASGDDAFEPQLGRHGKDVMWLPTPDALVARMLSMAGLGPQDKLVDLGSGDGKIVIAAARDFQAQALGVEFDPKMVEVSRRNAQDAGVSERARFVQGDIFEAEFPQATVVAMYLLPELNLRLRPKLMAMAPGTRIVTHQFDMGRWQPDEASLMANRAGYLWIVPANAGGQWQLNYPLEGETGQARLDIAQIFQKIQGSAELGALKTTLRQPRLSGERIAFAFTDARGELREFNGVIQGERMRGTVTGPQGSASFTAKRIGAAPPIGGSGPPSQQELNAAAAALGGE
ncbi:class I SAM-dependent methyltransferase [Orrella sp. JC864]|uniref:class I SAM-dependent methyltransferase n=1 Tax=Orrella sp. JC864 TaxID=3120298 RepID=UPI003008F77D